MVRALSIGAGLRRAVEYNDQRKQQKLLRDATLQSAQKSTPQGVASASNAPPSYDELEAKSTGRGGMRAADEKGSSIAESDDSASEYSTLDGEEEALESSPIDRSLPSYDDSEAGVRAHRQQVEDVNSVVPTATKPKLVDPNHPIYHGGLVGLVTGGALTPLVEMRRQSNADKRMARREWKMERKLARFERKVARREGRRACCS